MTHPFLKEASFSNEYISNSFPLANHTAFWQPLNQTITHWVLDDSEPVIYHFNEYGYRGQWTNDDIDDSVWCLGDSQTAGMGVHEQDLWPSLLSRLTKQKTINMGIGGASHDTIARTLISALRTYRPSAVCVLMTAPNRREIISDKGRSTFFPQAIKYLDKIDKSLYTQYIDSVDNTSNRINYDKNLMLIKSVCDALDIPVVCVDFTQHIYELAKQDPALDGEHLGPGIHKEVAEFFKNKL